MFCFRAISVFYALFFYILQKKQDFCNILRLVSLAYWWAELGGFGSKNVYNNDIWRQLLLVTWMNVFLGSCFMNLSQDWLVKFFVTIFHQMMNRVSKWYKIKSNTAWFFRSILVFMQYWISSPKWHRLLLFF